MEVNALPKFDISDNPTDCCPKFNPEGWDAQEIQFKDKLFVKAKTRSILRIPLISATYSTRSRPPIPEDLGQFVGAKRRC